MPTPTFYEFLNVSPTASRDEIEAAYKGKKEEWAHDPNMSQVIRTAYNNLSESFQRKIYDMHLHNPYFLSSVKMPDTYISPDDLMNNGQFVALGVKDGVEKVDEHYQSYLESIHQEEEMVSDQQVEADDSSIQPATSTNPSLEPVQFGIIICSSKVWEKITSNEEGLHYSYTRIIFLAIVLKDNVSFDDGLKAINQALSDQFPSLSQQPGWMQSSSAA